MDMNTVDFSFSSEGICYSIRLAQVVVYLTVIVLDQFKPSLLPQVEVLLRKDILKALCGSVKIPHHTP